MMGNQNGEVSVIEFYILVCSYLVCWVLINGRNTLGFIFIWWRMPRVLTMNINEMTMELLVKENEALKEDVKSLLRAGNLMKVNLAYSNDSFSRGYIALWKKAVNKLRGDNG